VGWSVEFLKVTPDGMYSNHWALKHYAHSHLHTNNKVKNLLRVTR